LRRCNETFLYVKEGNSFTLAWGTFFRLPISLSTTIYGAELRYLLKLPLYILTDKFSSVRRKRVGGRKSDGEEKYSQL
jgi:hypothetical protein